ncbi:t-box transcription factor TBX20 [Trichonephila clavipes]|nr:t-box transcription factor TBX20 [Trichonephila clavipes]
MDDNATCHRTLAVQDCLDSEGIQRLVWPSRSPDLNPIENVWDALGRQVAGRNYPPTNKNTLIRALAEEWDKLPQQLLDNVVQTLGRIPSGNELLVLASQGGASPWKFPGMPGLGMTDLNSLMASSNPQQAAAHLASLYFGIPRTFFPLSHLTATSGASMNQGDITGPIRTNAPSSYSQLAGNAMANQALYATRLQLSRLYPGLRFHPYFQPRLIHPPPVSKSTVDSNSDCDTMSPSV